MRASMLALDVNGTPVGKHFVYPLRRDFFFYTTSCAYNKFNFVDQGLDFNASFDPFLREINHSQRYKCCWALFWFWTVLIFSELSDIVVVTANVVLSNRLTAFTRKNC